MGLVLVIAIFASLFSVISGHAEKRVALVVGNNRYANLTEREQLQKAVSDAQAVGKALTEIKFDEVIVGQNLGRQAFVDKLDELAGKLSAGDTAFFFFSGHGVVLDGVNYVLPADVPDVAAGQITRLKGAALAEDYIESELLRSGARVAVVMLDACRNNPFARGGGKGVGTERGLQPRDAPSGVFTFYAAGRDEAALDRLYDGDPNPNGVFTRALLSALTRPGLDLTGIAIEVREKVTGLASTVRHDQHPAYYDGTSGGRIYLTGPSNGSDGSPNTAAADELTAHDWKLVEHSTSIAALEAFKRRYPGSFQADLADLRIAELQGAQVAVVVPTPAGSNPPAPQVAPATHTEFEPFSWLAMNKWCSFYKNKPYGDIYIFKETPNKAFNVEYYHGYKKEWNNFALKVASANKIEWIGSPAQIRDRAMSHSGGRKST
jgi:hypothetical protein